MGQGIEQQPQQLYPIEELVERKQITVQHGDTTQTVDLIVAQAWELQVDGHARRVSYVQVAQNALDGTLLQNFLPVAKDTPTLVSYLMGLRRGEDGIERETVDARFQGVWVRRDQLHEVGSTE